MIPACQESLLLAAFARALEAPAYQTLLAEAGVSPAHIFTHKDLLLCAPILDKQTTFGRFDLAALCRGGVWPAAAGVLTSSGHSGRFSFGVYSPEQAAAEADAVDDALDAMFAVRRRRTLLVNCLPMGVAVPTRACTLAQTSVRADMAVALVRELGDYYDQVILVGETAFIKHTLELGRRRGFAWGALTVHVIVGEEPLAENARGYLETLLGIDHPGPDQGMILSSMGVGEVGLNLFSETPPLAALRRRLHHDATARARLFGPGTTTTPMLFTYDPARMFVEVVAGRLVLTPLDEHRILPLIRYDTGDRALVLTREEIATAGFLERQLAAALPPDVIAIAGRDECALAGEQRIYPEQVKEGLYADHQLARLTTANFRLASGPKKVSIRIQLGEEVVADADWTEAFGQAIRQYVTAPFDIRCLPYAQFNDGMRLDYERKFAYLAG